jgi:hypothetical protein
MDQKSKPTKEQPSSTTTRPMKASPDGIVRSSRTNEELRALGIKVLTHSGKGFVLPTGRPSAQRDGGAAQPVGPEKITQ